MVVLYAWRAGAAVRIRSVPFEHIGWYGRVRTDFIMYRPLWGAAHYNIGILDWRPEDHWRLAGYGRVILLFKAVILNAVHSLAFIEVLYPVPVDAFQTEVGQIVNEEHGNVLLYGGAPARTYEVINTSEILGPVPIMRHPSHHTIPHGALVKDITHGAGDTEVGMGQGDGLQWTNIGKTEPKKGRFRIASAGLTELLQEGNTSFTPKEWAMHGFSHLERDDYVLVGHNYYVANGDGSELYILNYWAMSRGSFPQWITGDKVGRYSNAGTHETLSNPFLNVRTAVQYLLDLKGRFPIFICHYENGKANCNAETSGKSCECKTRVYPQVVDLLGGITVVCSSKSRYADAPAFCFRILGLNRYEVIANQKMQDLIEAWTVWKAQCRRQYEAGLGLVRKQKAGFRKGKGVCYKILDSIDVEDQHLYLVPSSEFPGVQASGVSEYFWGAQVWQGELPQSHLEQLGYVFPARRKKRKKKNNGGGTRRTGRHKKSRGG